MKDLIINDRNLGPCTAWRKNHYAVIPCWMFAMSAGFEVCVPLYMVKMFRSDGDLELTLYDIESPAKSEKEA